MLLNESRELHRLHMRFEQERTDVGATISGRRVELKMANSRALNARRNLAQTLLWSVVQANSKHRAELERAAAGTDTYAETVASAPSCASRVSFAKMLGSRVCSTASTPTRSTSRSSRATPTRLRVSREKAPQLTSQTTLDRRNGLVCAIMRAIWVPLRDARADGAAIRLPPVGALERLFISRPRQTPDEEKPPPVPPSND